MELKRRDRARVQTEMVEFIASPFPVSSPEVNIKFGHLISRRICAGTVKKIVQKSVKHVQSCLFAH